MNGANTLAIPVEAYDELGLGSNNRNQLAMHLAQRLTETIRNDRRLIPAGIPSTAGDCALVLDAVVRSMERHRTALKALTGKTSQYIFRQMRQKRLFSPEATCSLAIFEGARRYHTKRRSRGENDSEIIHEGQFSDLRAARICNAYITRRATMTSFDPCLLRHLETSRSDEIKQKLMRGICELVTAGFVWEKTDAFASVHMPPQRDAKPAPAAIAASKKVL